MTIEKIKCHACDGDMEPYKGPRHSRKVGGIMLGAGTLTTLFFIGPIIGLPLLIIGGYMLGAKRELWVCSQCHSAFEKIMLNTKKIAESKSLTNKLSNKDNLVKKVKIVDPLPSTVVKKSAATAGKKSMSDLPQTANVASIKEKKVVGDVQPKMATVGGSDLPQTTNLVK